MSDAYVIQEPGGTITLSPAVLDRIVARSAERADGAHVRRPRRGLEVSVADGRARVSLELAVRYGAVIPDVGEDVQRRVGEGLRTMCGLEPASVDVSVEEVAD